MCNKACFDDTLIRSLSCFLFCLLLAIEVKCMCFSSYKKLGVLDPWQSCNFWSRGKKKLLGMLKSHITEYLWCDIIQLTRKLWNRVQFTGYIISLFTFYVSLLISEVHKNEVLRFHCTFLAPIRILRSAYEKAFANCFAHHFKACVSFSIAYAAV